MQTKDITRLLKEYPNFEMLFQVLTKGILDWM